MNDERRAAALLALIVWCALGADVANAAPTPVPSPVATTYRKTVKPPPYPTKPMHAAYTVETNKEGQVVRVRSAETSKDTWFDTMTYGNSLQAFIRHPDGTAVAGVYKLIYDYSPQTKKVTRNVELLQAGGVDPNAKGAVYVELEKDAKWHAEQAAKAHPAPTSNAKLPDFSQIVSPSPKP